MTYQPTKFQLTHLLQDTWQRMGQLRTWKATGGSAITLVNTNWAGVEDEIFEDDDSALIYGTVVVKRTATNASPEGRFGMITDYDSSTQTVTMETVTDAISAGDKVGIATPLFPLEDMIELANIALRNLGEIDIVDTSLSVSANVTEYTLPSTIRSRPVSVSVQSFLGSAGNNQWKPINFDVIPAAPGLNWTLVVPHLPQGSTLQVVYSSLHPEVTVYDSDIIETVHPELAITSLIAESYQWYNNKVGGSNEYFLQRENKALQDFATAKVQFPVKRLPKKINGFPHWNSQADYIDLTSDLRA